MTRSGRVLFDKEEIRQAIEKIAGEIVREFCSGDQVRDFALVGLFKQGVPLAERLRERIREMCGFLPELARLDISMYRDDFGLRSALPIINETEIPFDMDEASVILVDDVLSTGRTIRAALDALTDYGRPDLIRLAVLVDRGNPEYPIRADYIGLEVHSSECKKILVEFEENDAVDQICEVEWWKD